MKKITLLLLFLLAVIAGSYGQVSIGNGTIITQAVPFHPRFEYSYGQSIYLAPEINASGSITSLQWYYSGNSPLTNSQNITIYLGHTTKEIFNSTTDYIPVASLTQVYIGGIVTNSTPGWKTITLTTPFVYNGIANLVVAVDENLAGKDDTTDRFWVTNIGTMRSIFAFSDTVNIDPANPITANGRQIIVPNIIFGGITQACPNPTAVMASGTTTTTVTASWTAASGQTQWEVFVGQQAPAPATVGTMVTGTPSFVQTGLSSNTQYSIYVRAVCSAALKSAWVGPRTFRTLCDNFGDFTENFDTSTPGSGQVPNCWRRIVTSTSPFANVGINNAGAFSPPNAFNMTTSQDPAAQLYLISPVLTAIGANTHRIKFKASGAGGGSQTLSVGTISNPTDASTYVEFQSYTLSSSYTDYSISFNTSTTASHIAFKHGAGGANRDVNLDDIVWEPIPAALPGCIDDINATRSETCGNFATPIVWVAAAGADGYKVSIGTSANGGNLVVNNVDVFNALSYSFSGNPGTQYFYTVRPYNGLGNAVGCFENSFSTVPTGCYCISVPIANDISGITNVSIGSSNFPVSDVTYANLTANGAADITQGVPTVMNVTLGTGSSHATNVWIDFNNNFTFEPSELVFSNGGSSTNIPTVVNTSFVTPLTAPVGEHRMRIVATNVFLQSTPNPCYNGTAGVTVDLLVNVAPAPTCLPPSSSTVSNITANNATINWVSPGTLFNVELVFATEQQGSGIITSGISGNTTILTNLNPQINYAYYIQTNCGSGNLSPWAGPFSFRSGCQSFGDFTQTFTQQSVAIPECWSSIVNSVTTDAYVRVDQFDKHATLYNHTDASAALYLITPALNSLPLNSHRIKFKALLRSFSTPNSTLVVGTMSDPSSSATFTAIQSIPLTATTDILNYQNYTVNFNTSTTAAYVAFKFIGSGNFQFVYLDDIIWEAAPLCPEINLVNAVGSSGTTANISWNPAGSETAWQYAYTSSNAQTPAGLATFDVVTNPSTTITGLTPSTIYKVWVRSKCGNNFGLWSPSSTFSTTCVTFSTPFAQDFSAFLPACWSTAAAGTIATGPSGTAAGIWTGGGFLNVGTTGAAKVHLFANNRVGWLVTPPVNTTIGLNYKLSFNYGVTIIDGIQSSPMGSDDFVKVAMSTNGGTSWTEIHTFNAASNVTNTSQLYNYEFTAGTSQIKFALVATDGIEYDDIDFEFFVDNFSIAGSLSDADFNKDSFIAYPNPVKDLLNLSFTQDISNVAIYNLLGQQVLLINVNSNKGQIDMSKLTSGTYLVKINTQNSVKTIKVVKE